MMTLRQLTSPPADVPSAVAWARADIGEARGKQELFTRQSPQRLKVLREHALIEFEERLARVGVAAPRGEKTHLVSRTIRQAQGTFRVADLQRKCPGVSLDLIRATLKKLRAADRVECLGRGQSAEWKKKASAPSPGAISP